MFHLTRWDSLDCRTRIQTLEADTAVGDPSDSGNRPKPERIPVPDQHRPPPPPPPPFLFLSSFLLLLLLVCYQFDHQRLFSPDWTFANTMDTVLCVRVCVVCTQVCVCVCAGVLDIC